MPSSGPCAGGPSGPSGWVSHRGRKEKEGAEIFFYRRDRRLGPKEVRTNPTASSEGHADCPTSQSPNREMLV